MKKNRTGCYLVNRDCHCRCGLELSEFLMGSRPIQECNVTIAYMTGWISSYALASKTVTANTNICDFLLVSDIVVSLLTAYVNATGALVDWAIPFVIILLGPWYGITIVTNSFLTASIIIALISLLC